MTYQKRMDLEKAAGKLEEAVELLIGIPGMEATREGIQKNVAAIDKVLDELEKKGRASIFDMVGYTNGLLAGWK